MNHSYLTSSTASIGASAVFVLTPSGMPSILSDDDKETVRRTVPKAANKIHAVAIARLYIAYPNRQRWTYTGIQGAAVLVNDLVGNTFWIKMVDISVRLPQGRVTMPSLRSRWYFSALGCRLTMYSPPIVGSCGIKRFTTHSHTIRIVHSSTHSSSRIVLPACLSLMKGRLNSSRRRWMSERRMRVRVPRQQCSVLVAVRR